MTLATQCQTVNRLQAVRWRDHSPIYRLTQWIGLLAVTINGLSPIASAQIETLTREVRVDREPIYDASILQIRSELSGVANPTREAILRTPESGTIMAWHVKEGETVEANQPLITLDNRLEQAALDVADSKAKQTAAVVGAELALANAKSAFERMTIAHRNHAASAFELEAKASELRQAQALYDQSRELQRQLQAELELAQVQLDRLTLRAPFRGQVIQLHAKVGNSVAADAPAVTVVQRDELEIEMYLPIVLFGKIRPGETYRFEASEPVGKTLPGVAVFCSPVVESTSGTFRCVFRVANREGNLPSGFQVRLLPVKP